MSKARQTAKSLIVQYRAVDPPWYVMALVVLAVGVLPGGIPVTTLVTPWYIRHRLAQRHRALTLGSTAAA